MFIKFMTCLKPMNKLLDLLQLKLGNKRIRENEPMDTHTTFRSGGVAEFYIDVETLDDLVFSVKTARSLNIPVFIFGGGTNIIISKEGINGLVIKNNCRKFEMAGVKGMIRNRQMDVKSALVYAESGTIVNQLVRYTIDQGYAALESALGLPGTVGGGIIMNSYNPKKKVAISESFYKARVLTADGTIKEVDKTYFHFDFNKTKIPKGDIILSAWFTLTPDDKKILWERGMGAVTYRTESSPKEKTIGCTFRNIRIIDIIHPPYTQEVPDINAVFSQCELTGKRIGNVGISQYNPRYILNYGDGNEKDMTTLINFIKTEVNKKLGYKVDMDISISSI